MYMNVKYAILVVMVVLSTALAPGTVVAQEQQTESSSESDQIIPYEVQQIINQEPSEVSQEDINRVQEWYSTNSDSLPEPVANSVQSWLEEAESQESQYTGPRWDSTAQTTYPFPERWNDNIRVYYVAYDIEDGVARVYIETDEPTTVVVADGTQTQSGAQLKTISEVDGRTILSVELRNPSKRHISVSANQGTWLHFGDRPFNFLPAAEYRILILLLGILVSMGTMLALEQFANRHDQEPTREV